MRVVGADDPSPPPRVSDKTLKTDEEVKAWDTQFTDVDQSTLFELILASRTPFVGRMSCQNLLCVKMDAVTS